MSVEVRRTSMQSGLVYTGFQVNSYQIPSHERVDKFKRDKHNLPEIYLQQYKNLNEGHANDLKIIPFWILLKKTGKFGSRFVNNFEQEDFLFERLT